MGVDVVVVGITVESTDGLLEGKSVGTSEGDSVVGDVIGAFGVGAPDTVDGVEDGNGDGGADGDTDGVSEGDAVLGSTVGKLDGTEIGAPDKESNDG